MTHRRRNTVRDQRLYGYINQDEQDTLLEAMDIRGINQKATAIRIFITERSEQIIIEHKRNQYKQDHIAAPTVHYSFPSGNTTASKFS